MTQTPTISRSSLAENAAVLTGPRVHLEDNPTSSSAKRACAIPLPVSRILTQPDVEMGAVPLPVLEDAMEVDFGAGVEPALVRRGAKRASAMWEERADQTDMEVCPDTTGECCNRDEVRILGWYATVGGIKTEQILVQECENVQKASQVRKAIRADSHQHDNVPQSQERRNPAESCDT